jgi:tripartite-type tricarboxylate transporter receptor subunit TctC
MRELKFVRSVRRTLSRMALAALLLSVATVQPVLAQDYPSQLVKVIIPFAAGGAVDLVGRPLAQKLGDEIGQSVVVENRAGAGSIIGVTTAAKAPPDGYTMLLTTGSVITTPLVNANAGYDPFRDLMPVTQVVHSQGTILATRPNFSANDLAGLVEAAKKSPGKFSYAHTGVGTPPYVAAELLRQYAGIELVAVPYKGTGNVLTDVIAGQVDMTFSGIPSVLEFARNRQVKAMASTGLRRSAVLPDVPTFQELGYRDMDVRGYYGLWFPAGTPPERVQLMQNAVAKVLKDPELQRIFGEGALEIVGSSPKEFEAFLIKDFERQKQIVQTLKLAPK